MKERVARQHIWSLQQPRIQITVLEQRWVEDVPLLDGAARWTQPREAQLCTVRRCEFFKFIELLNALASHHDGDLEGSEVDLLQVVHGAARGVITSHTAHSITRDGVRTVNGNLYIEVVNAREPLRRGPVNTRAIRGELHTNLLVYRVLDQFKKISAHHGLAATDVDVENLHSSDLVDQGLRFDRAQFIGVASTR
jgi:hypothetical protein